MIGILTKKNVRSIDNTRKRSCEMYKFILVLCLSLIVGCNFSPLSPSNRPRINNQGGEIGEIQNNQNGIMADILSIKNRLDLIARDVENLQNGFINNNNKNYGVQIFQGDAGIAVGLVLISILTLGILNYRSKAIKYKKTAELFGKKISEMHNENLENEIFKSALANNLEKNVYEVLNN